MESYNNRGHGNPGRNFVAVDVEYADAAQNICQFGLAVVRNLEITERRTWLIQPPGNHYDEMQTRIHGIRPEDTAGMPALRDVWPEIEPYLDNEVLWAHNAAAVEEPVINKNLAQHGIAPKYGWYFFYDSRVLYRRPDCEAGKGNGLVQCCMAQGIPYENHHDAGADAEMCARLVIACVEGRRPVWDGVPVSNEEMRKSQQEKHVVRLGGFREYYEGMSSGEEDVFAVISSTYEGSPEYVVDVFDKGDTMPKEKDGLVDFARLRTGEDGPLYGKKVVITGAFSVNRKEIERAVSAMGAKKIPNPTRNADAIIIGQVNVSGNKLMALEEQEEKGHRIARIVGDADLEELLYGDGWKFFKP